MLDRRHFLGFWVQYSEFMNQKATEEKYPMNKSVNIPFYISVFSDGFSFKPVLSAFFSIDNKY
jgi:hypothetical protein